MKRKNYEKHSEIPDQNGIVEKTILSKKHNMLPKQHFCFGLIYLKALVL
jgi:hypothetical protein